MAAGALLLSRADTKRLSAAVDGTLATEDFFKTYFAKRSGTSFDDE
jgi:hypothetical protein